MLYKKYLLGLTLAAGLGAQVAPAQEAILGHVMDSEHIFHHVAKRFMGRLEELSGGSFTIDYHPGGDLGDRATITEQVAQGAVQMAFSEVHTTGTCCC